MMDSYQLGRRGRNDNAAGVNTSTIQDDALAGPGAAEGIEVGCDVRIRQDDDPAGGTVRYHGARIDSRPQQSNGRFTFTAALPSPMETPDTDLNITDYAILFRPLTFQDKFDAIDQTLSDYLWEKLLVPITLVPDGDMLKATLSTGVSGDWRETGAAAPTRAVASFPYGLRELVVVSTGASQYVATAPIDVEDGESYYVEATARPMGSYNAQLILRDLTNGANIALDETITTIGREPELLITAAVTMPTNCRQVELRLNSSDAGAATTRWSNIIFRKNSTREYVVQDRSANFDRLGKLFATNRDQWAERPGTMIEIAATPEMRTEGLWFYRSEQDNALAGYSVWHEEFIRRGALTSDTATVGLDKQDVAAVATYLMLDKRGLGEHERFKGAYKRATQRTAAVLSVNAEKLRTRELVERVYPLPVV